METIKLTKPELMQYQSFIYMMQIKFGFNKKQIINKLSVDKKFTQNIEKFDFKMKDYEVWKNN